MFRPNTDIYSIEEMIILDGWYRFDKDEIRDNIFRVLRHHLQDMDNEEILHSIIYEHKFNIEEFKYEE